MNTEKNKETSFSDYSELWNNNLEKIEKIHKNLDHNLLQLEKKYYVFEEIYEKIILDIDLLSSIYSSFNSISGMDYVLKLNAVMNDYKKRYTRDSINFEMINYLSEKIKKLRNDSFADFPVMQHNLHPEKVSQLLKEKRIKIAQNRPFKWITFQRNSSWFIKPFNHLQVLYSKKFNTISIDESGNYYTEYNSRKLIFKDLMIPLSRKSTTPEYLISINEGEKFFPADRIGKKIYAGKDIITPLKRPLKKPVSSKETLGRVRIFGNMHLFLR